MESKKVIKKKIKKVSNLSYECKIYLGSINEKTKEKFRHSRLIKNIRNFQSDYEIMIPVRIEKTRYYSGIHYNEAGYVISAINYPRIKVDSATRPEKIKLFMQELAKKILIDFNQKRVSVVDDHETTMYEQEIQ